MPRRQIGQERFRLGGGWHVAELTLNWTYEAAMIDATGVHLIDAWAQHHPFPEQSSPRAASAGTATSIEIGCAWRIGL